MVYVLGFLLGCCLGVGLYYLEKCNHKIYFKIKGFIEKSYGKEKTLTKVITISICACLWLVVWVIYYGGVMIAVHILKPLL